MSGYSEKDGKDGKDGKDEKSGYSEYWKDEIFIQFKEVFDLLQDTEKLEKFLENLSETKRNELYSHPFVQEFDLLP